MSSAVQFGPIVLAAERLMAVASIWGFLALTAWWPAADRPRLQQTAWLAIGVGLVAARVGYVATHAASFAQEPLSALFVWQGGFSPLAGIGAGAIALVWRLGVNRRALPALAALALVSGLWFAGSLAFDRQAAQPLPKGLVAYGLDGAGLPLDRFRSRPLVINLWATWCPPCRREMPMLAAAAAARPDVTFLFINQGEDARSVQRYLDAEGLVLSHALLSPNGELARRLRSPGLPTTLFVTPSGDVRAVHTGEISRAALDDELARLEGSRTRLAAK